MGSNQKVKVDVRVMAATNRDLEAEYRKELSARIFISASTWSPCICPRCASAAPTFPCWRMVSRTPRSRNPCRLRSAAMKGLLQYDWPGNVRELENCMERAVALGDRRIIEVSDLPPEHRLGDPQRASCGIDRSDPLLPPTWKTSSAPPSSAFSTRSKATRPWPARCSASAAPLCIASSSATTSAPVLRPRKPCSKLLVRSNAFKGFQ